MEAFYNILQISMALGFGTIIFLISGAIGVAIGVWVISIIMDLPDIFREYFSKD